MKKRNIYKGWLPGWPDEFSHRFACWAQNHRGWAKAKRMSRRLAKIRERRQLRKEMDEVYEDIKEVPSTDIHSSGCNYDQMVGLRVDN